MLELLNSIINAVSGILYKPWCVPLILLAGGIILTVRSRFIQVRMFTESFKVIMEKPRTENGISSFGALMVSTASRVGTGNIKLALIHIEKFAFKLEMPTANTT